MDNRKDTHDFLVSRRAKVTPAQAGLPAYDNKRRVPGPRREGVASLAGVSFDYYARLERGNLSGVSEPVPESAAAPDPDTIALDTFKHSPQRPTTT